MPNGVVLSGPKTPHWGCNCGEASNWASRLNCRQCGRQASGKVVAAAKANAKAPAPSKPKGPGGAWSAGPPGSGRVAELESKVAQLEQKLKLGLGGGGSTQSQTDGADDDVPARRATLQKQIDGVQLSIFNYD